MTMISIIIPCYNEEATVYPLLEKVAAQTLASLNVEREIVVVDDGSTDRSLEQIKLFRDRHPALPLKVLSNSPRLGKGWSVRKALEAAQGEIILIQDADLEYDPSDYEALMRPVLLGVTPVVYGSRWLAPEIHISGTLALLGGWLENRLLHTLYRTNISDIATGYKVFRADLLRSLNLDCRGFEFCPEVTAKLLNRGVTIIEEPIHYIPRNKREGKKIRWPDFFIAVATLVRVRFKRL